MIVEWMERFCTNDGVKICYLILENESLPFLDQKLFTIVLQFILSIYTETIFHVGIYIETGNFYVVWFISMVLSLEQIRQDFVKSIRVFKHLKTCNFFESKVFSTISFFSLTFHEFSKKIVDISQTTFSLIHQAYFEASKVD